MRGLHPICQSIITSFENNLNEDDAFAMKQYLKNNFEFFGIKANSRRDIVWKQLDAFKELDKNEKQAVINQLWSRSERECHHAALDLSSKILKKMDTSWTLFWEEKITSNSWWDTVDYITPTIIGLHCIKNDSNFTKHYVHKWMESDNLWLQRSAIILQLKYKSKTNPDILFDAILGLLSNKDFFIRKASGWALREYSKTNPLQVSEFINTHREILPKLTVQEGERLMKEK